MLEGKPFIDDAHCDSTGFYDWLRDENSNLLGIRYWPDDETEFLIAVAEGLNYASTKPKHFFEIFFSKNRSFKDTLSCDQDFLHNPVFKAADGEYAIAFGMEQLTEENLAQLDQVDAHWLKLQTI